VAPRTATTIVINAVSPTSAVNDPSAVKTQIYAVTWRVAQKPMRRFELRLSLGSLRNSENFSNIWGYPMDWTMAGLIIINLVMIIWGIKNWKLEKEQQRIRRAQIDADIKVKMAELDKRLGI